MAIAPILPIGAGPFVGGAIKSSEMAPDANQEPLAGLPEDMSAEGLLGAGPEPVVDEEDLQTRKKGWAVALNEMLADPDTPLLMYSMAQVMGQPLKPGENPLARVAQGFATGEALKRQLKAGRTAEAAAARKEAREDYETYITPALNRRSEERRAKPEDPGDYEKTRRAMYRQVLAEQGLADTEANRAKVAKEVGDRLSGRYSKTPAVATLPPTDPRWVDVKLHEELQAWDPFLDEGPYPYEERRLYWQEQQKLAVRGLGPITEPPPADEPSQAAGPTRRYNPKTGRIE